jgi:hypothetical protein
VLTLGNPVKSTRVEALDTLYDAVALCRPDAALVTADERYYRQPGKLAEWFSSRTSGSRLNRPELD